MEKDIYVQIILSESVQNVQSGMNQSLSVINPFKALFLPYIPTAASFGVTVVLYATKVVKDIKIVLSIKHDNTEKEIFTTGESVVNLPANFVPEFSNFNLNVDLRNIGIEKQGWYTVTCTVNGEDFTESFIVHKQNPNSDIVSINE